MAALARLPPLLIDCTNCNYLGFSRHSAVTAIISIPRRKSPAITCSASNEPSSSKIRSQMFMNMLSYTFRHLKFIMDRAQTEFSNINKLGKKHANNIETPFSSTAKIRSEVLTPFRSVRMFFYLAFIASGSLGGLIATSQLIGALANPSRGAQVPEILKGLAIDIGAVSVFAFLYYRENNAKNAQIARLSREETLSNLKLRIDEKRTLPLSAFRGIARLVILAGPASYIEESFRRSESFSEGLLERAVLVVPFATDGNPLKLEFEEKEETKEMNAKRKRLWQLAPVFSADWTTWLDEQKKMANVLSESPVYLSLRMDGRVRGSGVGYPPWNAFVLQLPPVKGLWSGLLDGMDGRVL